jgi:glycosyltransferase involved in cell wall biosynthesis
MRPLKIALLSEGYWLESQIHLDEEGGAIRQLAEAVAALGHEVVVLTQNSEVRKLKQIELGALETWASPRGRHRNLFTRWRDRFARKTYFHPQVYTDALALRDFLALRGPFDVLWAPAESPEGLVAAIAAHLKVKLPPVLVQIQALRCRYEKGAPVFTEKLPLDIAFRQASRILAPSPLIAGCLPDYAGPGHTAEDLQAKVRVVYPNLQRAFFQAAKQIPTAPRNDRVLFLGSLNQHKGALVFLRAVAKTEAAKRNSLFVVMGDFTEHNKRFIKRWEETKEATGSQLSGAWMEYIGRVSTTEVIRQIQLARVVVLPALFDAFSRGVVEALILGRPVITTDRVGAAPLVVTHQCGIVVAPNDPDALAQAIDVVLSPIVPFAENAKYVSQTLCEEFSPEAIAPQIVYHLSRIAVPAT